MMKILNIYVCIVFISIVSSVQAQTWQSIGPYGGNLNAVAVHPKDSKIVLVGTDYGVYRSVDAGETWQATSIKGVVRAIVFAPDNSDVVYAGGENLYKSTDAGGIWKQIASSIGVLALASSDSRTVYFGSSEGLFMNTGGLSGWAGLDGDVHAVEIDPGKHDTIYVATASSNDPARIYKTINAGETWTILLDINSLPNVDDKSFTCLAIDPRDPKTIYAGGGKTNVYKSIDAGKTWSRVFSEPNDSFIHTIAISPGADTSIYIGYDRRGYRSIDGGKNWSVWTLDFATFNDLIISPDGKNTLYSATSVGFCKSNDAGASWMKRSTGLPAIYTHSLAIDPIHNGTIYAGTAGSSVVKTVDGGTSWQQASLVNPYMWIMVFSPRDPNVLYGCGGAIHRSVDGAKNWEQTKGSPVGQVYGISFAPSDTRIVYAPSDQEQSIFKSIDGGRFWNVISVTDFHPVNIIVDAINPDLVYALMHKEGIIWMRRSTDGGFTWENIRQVKSIYGGWHLGNQLFAADPQVSGTVYLVDEDIEISTDSGNTWKTFAFADRQDMRCITFDPQNPQVIYAGSGQKVYQSTDKGRAWADMGAPGANITSIYPDPHISGRVYVATDTGIYVYTTGAKDTTPPNPPSGLKVTASNGSATLTWAANQEADIAGYQIRYGTEKLSYPASVDTGKTTYTLTHLTDPYYYFTVTAYDASRNYSLPSAALEAHFPENESTIQPTQPGSFSLQLSAGLHMISLPLKPAENMNARSFAKMLGSSIVVQYDEDNARFSAYLPAVATIDGFAIKGGYGYIVNLIEAKTINFTGTAWSGAPARSQNQKTGSLWAFVLGGQLPQGFKADQLTLLNPRNGFMAQAESQGEGVFGSALVGAEGYPVVITGDMLEIHCGARVIARHHVTSSEMRLAYGILSVSEQIPSRTRLLQNFPNPFNPETWIPYNLAKDGDAIIRIYDTQGILVRSLKPGYQPAGSYTDRETAAYWDGKNDAGEKVCSGVYFYSLHISGYQEIRKMIIVW